jgi:Polysaccharide pyruvyl transferase
MEAVVRGLVAEAVVADAPFVVQSEWEELCVADRARGYRWRPLRLLLQAYHGMVPRRDLRNWLLERMTVYWTVEEWLDAMREVDCVIGTRLHGTIAALLAGTPSLLIVHDTRTEEVARHFALPRVRLDEIDTVRLDELAQMADPAPVVARYRELLPEFNRFLRRNNLEPTASDVVRPSAASGPTAQAAVEPEPASG